MNILNEISFEVKGGQTVAIIGKSGSGKSTCIQLLQRFYDVSSGSIKLGNRDVNDIDLVELRNSIGVVNQEPILFDTTISENIRLGNENATQEAIEKAAKDANAHEFIMGLPKVNYIYYRSSN